jgi:Raf kinase inhibitor-like YbhB/YbcL family protein
MNHNHRSRCFLGPLSLKVLGGIILASFVFLAFFPIQRDDDSTAFFSASASFEIATGDQQHEVMTTTAFTLSSPAFVHGDAIPALFARTSTNNDVSPPLTWSNIHDGTSSLVLIMDDPDAPNPEAPRSTPWVHWVLYNIPPTTSKLAAGVGVSSSRTLPPGTMQGLNDWNEVGYGGPSPPIGTHRYFFKLYALDIVVLDNNNILQQQQHEQNKAATKATVVQAMQGHVLGQAELMGTYKQQK